MGDKIRGGIAILVGAFGLYQSYMLYQTYHRDWHMWLELAAGVILILLGTWRIRRKPPDPIAALYK